MNGQTIQYLHMLEIEEDLKRLAKQFNFKQLSPVSFLHFHHFSLPLSFINSEKPKPKPKTAPSNFRASMSTTWIYLTWNTMPLAKVYILTLQTEYSSFIDYFRFHSFLD